MNNSATRPHAKFFGRKASPCRRCGGVLHYVNRLGGIVCLKCSAPKCHETDVRGMLTIECGVWIDPDDRFSYVDEPTGQDSTASSTERTTSGAADPTPITGQKSASGSAAQGLQTTQQSRFENDPVWSRYMRGPSEELSEFEVELFTSDEVWSSDSGPVITLKSSSSRRDMNQKTKDADGRNQPSDIACRGALTDRVKDKAVASLPAREWNGRRSSSGDASQDSGEIDPTGEGEIVLVTRSVPTFAGSIAAGTECRVSSVWRDSFGDSFCNLADARTGVTMVTGLSLDGIRKA